LDTPARQCSKKFGIALAYSYFGFALDTPARQCSKKFGIALAYSYLCLKISVSIMASSGKKSTPASNAAAAERSNRDSARWTAGLVVFIIGLFITASVFFYLFTWKEDASLLSGIDSDNPLKDDSAANPCGVLGAKLGYLIVCRGFGLFGIVLPVMLTMVGVRIIRRRPLLFNHSFLSAMLVLILGSLSLGAAFADSWGVFGSGWGGACGIEMARRLTDAVGHFGDAIILGAGWILTGVFMNRNFINTVNSAGNAVVDRSERIVEIMKNRVAASTADRTPDTELDGSCGREAAPEEPVRPEPEPDLEPEPEIRSPEPEPAVRHAEPEPAGVPAEEDGEEPYRAPVVLNDIYGTVVPESMRRRVFDENPFEEVSLDGGGERTSVPEPAPEAGAASQPEEAAQPADDGNPFVEVSLADAEHSPAPACSPESQAAPHDSPEGGIVVTVEDREARVMDEKDIDNTPYDPMKDLYDYRSPVVSLLENYSSSSKVGDAEIYENKSKIESTLKNFGIAIRSIRATSGPTVTLYEIVQAEGVKISKIQGLEDDIAQSLKALGIRIIAPIPGKGTIGIEVPNRDKQIVSMYSSVCSPEFQNSKAELPVVIGRTIQNENYTFDLAKMPHLLVAGATGQGKSVGLNAIITSLLYRKHPSQLKLVMIDPKMVEFSPYAKLERHFLAKMASEEEAIITDPKKAVYTLNSLEMEMDNRLELCKKAGARNIVEYNDKFVNRRLNPLHGHKYLPYIVVIIDEFADLIMTAKEVERPVMRLAQKARAIGIHLIIATQRPDVKVITGGIKANFPARIAFRVMQMIDSRTIIDQPGANQLIGRGDMLFSKDGELTRIQCALVETKEVERIVDYIARQQGYPEAYALPDYVPESGGGEPGGFGSEEYAPVKYDSLFAEIARVAVSSGQISTSSIQRNYEVGFNRAGRIMMQLERSGIVGKQEGAKPRAILFHDLPSLEARLQELGVF